MPSDIEPSPLHLSGNRRIRKQNIASNIELTEVPISFSDDNNYESIDEEEFELAADKENLIQRIRKEMLKERKKQFKKVRLSNDFINKKSKKDVYVEESVFYNKERREEDEYQEGDEFVLDMNEVDDEDDDGNYGDEEEGTDREDDVDDNFGILGILNKNARNVL